MATCPSSSGVIGTVWLFPTYRNGAKFGAERSKTKSARGLSPFKKGWRKNWGGAVGY